MDHFRRELETSSLQSPAQYPTPSSSGRNLTLFRYGEQSPTAAKSSRKATASTSRTSKEPSNSGRMIWQKPHRLALHLLLSRFELDWDETARVFNQLFKTHILECLKGNDIQVRTLRTQYSSNERKKPYWLSIINHTLLNAETAELEQLSLAIERCIGKSSPPLARKSPQTPTSRAAATQRRSQPISQPQAILTPRQRAQPALQLPTPPSGSSQLVQTPRRAVYPQEFPMPALRLEPLSGVTVRPGMMQITEFVNPDYEYVPITPEKAHPDMPALLYRVYDSRSFGANSGRGFVSGLFEYNQGGSYPAPECSHPSMLAFAENHINRNPVSSPVISGSVSFFWVLREALKRQARGNHQGVRIAIINAEAAHATTRAYFVPPYTSELRNKGVFTKGAQRYRGSHEFLIWSHVTKDAILCDISIEQLQAHIAKLPELASAMRLDLIGKANVAKEKIQRELKVLATPLTISLTTELAKLLMALGVNASAPPAMITKLVSDFTLGWQIGIEKDSSTRWDGLSGAFALALTAREATDAQFKAVKEAFLAGLRSGMGDLYWEISPDKTRVMHSRARKVGLEPELPKQVTRRRPRRQLMAEPWVIIESPPATRLDLERFRYNARNQARTQAHARDDMAIGEIDAIQYEHEDEADEEEIGNDSSLVMGEDDLMLTAEDLQYVAERERVGDMMDMDYEENMTDED